MARFGFFKTIPPGEMIPPFRGVCWYTPDLRVVTCPMPCNLGLRLLRVAYCFLRRPLRFFDAVYTQDRLDRRITRLEMEKVVLQHNVDQAAGEIAALRSLAHRYRTGLPYPKSDRISD